MMELKVAIAGNREGVTGNSILTGGAGYLLTLIPWYVFKSPLAPQMCRPLEEFCEDDT